MMLSSSHILNVTLSQSMYIRNTMRAHSTMIWPFWNWAYQSISKIIHTSVQHAYPIATPISLANGAGLRVGAKMHLEISANTKTFWKRSMYRSFHITNASSNWRTHVLATRINWIQVSFVPAVKKVKMHAKVMVAAQWCASETVCGNWLASCHGESVSKSE